MQVSVCKSVQPMGSSLYGGCAQGEMKLQIDRMIAKFFSSLPVDEQLNFSVAVTVMSVQRKWRQRMKAHKVCTSPRSVP